MSIESCPADAMPPGHQERAAYVVQGGVEVGSARYGADRMLLRAR